MMLLQEDQRRDPSKRKKRKKSRRQEQINNDNITSSSKQRQTITKKSVRFATKGSVKSALHLNAYTPTELQASFYTRKEMRKMKEHVEYTVRLIGLNKLIDEVQLSRRGIDYAYTDEARDLKHRRKSAANYVVLKKHPASATTKVAKAYASISQECKESARNIGLLDEQFVIISFGRRTGAVSPPPPPPPPPPVTSPGSSG